MLPLLMAGGALLKGIGSYQQGQFQGDLSDFNASQDILDASITRRNADIRADALRRSGRELIGTQRTKRAKSGLRLEGTPLELMAESMENIELDAIAIKQQGEFAGRQKEVSAKFKRSMGDAQRRAGTIGLLTGGISAGGMFA